MVSTGEQVGWRAWLHKPLTVFDGGKFTVEETEMFRHGTAGKRSCVSNEQERSANEWFTSRGVAGDVTARQDGWRTTNTRSTVHGKTFDVPFDIVQLLT